MPAKQHAERLAEKLLAIRKALGLSQNELIRRLGFVNELTQGHISAYERKRNQRVPPLGVVLAYARAANVAMETIVDDDLELPTELSSTIENRS